MSANNFAKKVWSIVDALSAQGIGYIDSIALFSQLFFLKVDNELIELRGFSRVPEACRWSTLLYQYGGKNKLSPEEQVQHYMEIVEVLSSEINHDLMVQNIFTKVQAKIDKDIYLSKIISLINDVQWLDFNPEDRVSFYERLLERNSQDSRSGAGQYFTQRSLIRMMVEVIDPHVGELVWDPACGTGGFLLAAYEHICQQKPSLGELNLLQEQNLRGQDNVPLVVTLGTMNMFLHGFDVVTPPIQLGNSLLTLPQTRADVVLSDPPLGVCNSDAIKIERADFVTQCNNRQINFLQHIMSLLKDGGRAAVVVPDNVLFTREAKSVRRALLTNFNLHTILWLPLGISYAQSALTNIIFFTKGQPTTDVWIYDLRNNVSFSTARKPLQRKDLVDFINCYHADGHGGYGERYETYDLESHPTGRWRKFSAAYFLQRDDCSFSVPAWIRGNTLENFDQENVVKVLAEMERHVRLMSECVEFFKSELLSAKN